MFVYYVLQGGIGKNLCVVVAGSYVQESKIVIMGEHWTTTAEHNEAPGPV